MTFSWVDKNCIFNKGSGLYIYIYMLIVYVYI